MGGPGRRQAISETGGDEIGGAEGDRTPDLRIANAALSQLSYGPEEKGWIKIVTMASGVEV